MKKIMLVLTFVIFCTSVFSSQVDFTQYRQITISELHNINYKVVLRNENNEPILIIVDGEVLYIKYQ